MSTKPNRRYKAMADRSFEQVSSGLARTKVLWARYRSFRDVVDHDAKALRDDPLFHEVDQPGVGSLLRAGMPLTMAGRDAVPTPAPAVGQHTREVLAEVLGHPGDQPAFPPQPSRTA